MINFQVCINIAKCYSVAAQFEGCREKIQECSGIIRDLCRILYFKVWKSLPLASYGIKSIARNT
jgi:DnaJ family protein C protein 13